MRSMVDRISVTASPVAGMAVAELAHQGLGGMRERFQPRQAEEAAGALDGVHQAENVVEDLGVVGILLETHELDVDDVEAFVRLGQNSRSRSSMKNAFVDGRGPYRRSPSGARPVCRKSV